MTTPQDPPKRRKQKIRRTKRLEAWRAAHPRTETTGTSPAKSGGEGGGR